MLSFPLPSGLSRRRKARKPFGSADNLGDFHQMVVNYVGKVICRELVGGFPQDFVVQGDGLDFHLVADKVVHLDGLAFRDLETDGPGVGGLDESLDFVWREGEGVFQALSALVVVDEGLLCGLCLCP